MLPATLRAAGARCTRCCSTARSPLPAAAHLGAALGKVVRADRAGGPCKAPRRTAAQAQAASPRQAAGRAARCGGASARAADAGGRWRARRPRLGAASGLPPRARRPAPARPGQPWGTGPPSGALASLIRAHDQPLAAPASTTAPHCAAVRPRQHPRIAAGPSAGRAFERRPHAADI